MEELEQECSLENQALELKSKICVFCGDLIEERKDSLENGVIKATFLRAVNLLVELLELTGQVETENWGFCEENKSFPGLLCCMGCYRQLNKMVCLEQLILEKQAELNETVENLKDILVESEQRTDLEYSINACVRFRQGILKSIPQEKGSRYNAIVLDSDSEDTDSDNCLKSPKPEPDNSIPSPLSSVCSSGPLENNQTSVSIVSSSRSLPKSVFVKVEIPKDNYVNENEVTSSEEGSENEDDPSFDNDPVFPSSSSSEDEQEYLPPASKRRRTCQQEISPNLQRTTHVPPGTEMTVSSGQTEAPLTDVPKELSPQPSDSEADAKPPEENEEDQYSSEDDSDSSDANDQVPKRKVKTRRDNYTAFADGSHPHPVYALSASTNLFMVYQVQFLRLATHLQCLHPNCTYSLSLPGLCPGGDFSSYRTLRTHIRQQHRKSAKSKTSPQYRYCHICNAQMLTAHRKHWHSQHAGARKPFVLCEVCGIITLKSTRKHYLSHLSAEERSNVNFPNRLKCPHCPLTFVLEKPLKDHLTCHIPLEIRYKRYSCHLCKACFADPYKLKRHLRNFDHSCAIKKESAADTEDNLKIISLLKPTYQLPNNLLMMYNIQFQRTATHLQCLYPGCPHEEPFTSHSPAGDIFTFRKFRGHVRRIHRNGIASLYYCHLCKSHLTSLKLHQQHWKNLHSSVKPIPLPVVCEICGESIPKRYLLSKHHETHLNPEDQLDARLAKQYPCDHCPKIFSDKIYLKRHKFRHKFPIETRRLKNLCPVCGSGFQSSTGMRYHYNTIHLKIGPKRRHHCRICGKGFPDKVTWMDHINAHMGNRPFQCSQCGLAFTGRDNLRQHQRRVHESTEMACEFCPGVYKFLKEHQLRQHPELVARKGLGEREGMKKTRSKVFGPRRMFPCEPCGVVHKYWGKLRAHLRIKHKIVLEKKDCPPIWTEEDLEEWKRKAENN